MLDGYLQRLSGFGYSGAVLVSADGRVILRKGYGLADRAAKEPIRPATRFDIGSLSKTFTAAAVLRLEADGALRVEDPISHFLPGVPEDKRAISIHQLLTHSSGVAGPDIGYRVVSKAEALQEILSRPLRFQPGAGWSYSNAGYVLLAAIIESASGETYQRYLQGHLFRRAGLRSTGFWGRALPPGPARLNAKGYDESGVVADLERLSGDTWNDIGSGQIVSTVDDLFRWQKSLEGGRVLPDRQVRKMLAPWRKGEPSESYFTSSYGCGVWSQTLPDGTRRIHHGGDSLGFGSQLTWLPDRRVVIAALCNVRQDLYPIHRRADRAIPDLLAGMKVAQPPEHLIYPRAENNRYLGKFKLPNGDVLAVHWSSRGLAVGAIGQEAALYLDGTSEEAEGLRAAGEASARLVPAVLRGDMPVLSEAGLGDPDSLRDLRLELAALGEGRGAFKGVTHLGTYVGGLLGKFYTSLLRVDFEGGGATYKVQWDGSKVIGTDIRCPEFAAFTLLQPKSKQELVGWNIVTLRSFTLRYAEGGRVLRVVSGHGDVSAVRQD